MRKLFILLSIPLAFTACKKEESPEPTQGPVNITFPGPKANVIINKNWKLTDKLIEYSNGLPSETYSNVPDCQKDNLIKFKPNKQYDINEAVDMCPGQPPVTTHNWSMTSNEQQINIDNTRWDIVSVSETTLQIRNINKGPTLMVTTTETYTAQ